MTEGVAGSGRRPLFVMWTKPWTAALRQLPSLRFIDIHEYGRLKRFNMGNLSIPMYLYVEDAYRIAIAPPQPAGRLPDRDGAVLAGGADAHVRGAVARERRRGPELVIELGAERLGPGSHGEARPVVLL